MKRCVNKIFILLTVACLLTGLFSGCRVFARREDVIPKKLGTQEGLWLYYKDKRSRTDGTEKQDILTTVEYAEKSYGRDSFVIHKLIYLTHIKTIVFWLSVFDEAEETAEEGNGEVEENAVDGESEKTKKETQILYRYSYKEKTGEALYTLPCLYDNIEMDWTNNYFYVKAGDSGILFNSSLELIGDDFIDCTFENDVLYRCTKKIREEYNNAECWMLEWYRNGTWKSSWLDHTRSDELHRFSCAGDYIYVFDYGTSITDNYYHQYVNLKTGEQGEGNGWLNQKFVLNNEFYICDRDSNANPTTYSLYLVNGMNFKRIYRFEAELSLYIETYHSDDDWYYLKLEDSRAGDTNYCKMNKRTHEVQMTPRLERYFEITIGGYTFYQNERLYNGIIFSENCVYMWRERDGKKEVMQYKLSEDIDGYFGEKYNVNSRLFYNDICEF